MGQSGGLHSSRPSIEKEKPHREVRGLGLIGGCVDDRPQMDQDGQGPRQHQKREKVEDGRRCEKEERRQDAALDKLAQSGDDNVRESGDHISGAASTRVAGALTHWIYNIARGAQVAHFSMSGDCNSGDDSLFMGAVRKFGVIAIAICWGTSLLGSGEYARQKSSGYFEGALRYVVSRYSPRSGKALERTQVNVLATEKRLSVPELDANEVFANNAPPGVSSALFLHDDRDFILYGDGVDAYRFGGIDQALLGVAFRALALAGAPVDMLGPEESGPYALRGFRTGLMRYRGESDLRYDMYFTSDYRVNWGSIAGGWLFGSGGLKVPGLPEALQRGEVPVRIEAFKGELKLFSINLMLADEIPIDPEWVAIPKRKIMRSSTSLLSSLAKEAMAVGD